MDQKQALASIATWLAFDSENEEEEMPMKKRKCWAKNWVLRRSEEGFCAKLLIELKVEEPEFYHNFVRMDLQQYENLLALVTPLIQKQDTVMRESISANERLMLTLRFLATGESFHSLQYLFRIPLATISAIVPEVLDAIYKVLVDEYLQVCLFCSLNNVILNCETPSIIKESFYFIFQTPKTADDWESVAQEFNDLWQFPNCLGAVDGKHVVMFAPPNVGSNFYNYKGTHSIILMGIADANYKLLYIDVGRNGRFSDGGVFNRCTFGQAMDQNELGFPAPKPLPGRTMPVPYVLVADDAFALRENVIKPYPQRGLDMVQRVFNYRLSRARRIIENVFGIMSARFRVLRNPIYLNAEKTKKVVLATCVLHNYLITTNKQKYAPVSSFDHYNNNGELVGGDWREDGASGTTMFGIESNDDASDTTAKDFRDEFKSYFIDEGEVDWQYRMI